MLLCLDCGNSRLKWGLRAAGQTDWLAQGALALGDIDRLPHEIRGIVGPLRPTRIVGCIVADDAARLALERAADDLGTALEWNASCAAQCGVRSDYDDPGQLGADRWAALVGARHLHGHGPCLVVTAGTATTVDRLDADGRFRGGLILPGLDLMRTSLAHRTARLPLAQGDFQPLPRNTRAAIASGCLQATAGAVERMFGPLAHEAAALCLLSGGAAENIAPLLDIPLRRIENLVLEGLARIATEPGR